MKSAKVFLLLMLALYIGLFFFDYLKAIVYPIHNHSLMIWLKTVFLVVGGIVIMKVTLEKRVFKTFIIIYLSIWAIYYIIKMIGKLPAQPSAANIRINQVMLFYLNITQLLTPFPFFFFWVLNRVFNSGMMKDLTNKSGTGDLKS